MHEIQINNVLFENTGRTKLDFLFNMVVGHMVPTPLNFSEIKKTLNSQEVNSAV